MCFLEYLLYFCRYIKSFTVSFIRSCNLKFCSQVNLIKLNLIVIRFIIFVFGVSIGCFTQPMVDSTLRQSVMASIWARAQFQEGLASSSRVKVYNGYKNIQDLVVGDLLTVPSSNELQEVILIETRLLPYYYEIKLDQGLFQAAPAQRIYDAYKNLWIETQYLTDQDYIGVHPILSIQKIEQYLPVYKLHTTNHIFELDGDIIVHNFDVATVCSVGLTIGQIIVQHPVLALIGRTVSLTKLAISIYQRHQEYQQHVMALLDALRVQDVVIETRNYYEMRRKQLLDLLEHYKGMQRVVEVVAHKSVLNVALFSTGMVHGQEIALLPALQTELQYTVHERQRLLILRQQNLEAIEKEIQDIQLSIAIYFNELLDMHDALLADIDKLVKEYHQITELWDPAGIACYSLSDLLFMSIKNLTFLDLYINQLEIIVQDLSFFMNICEQNQQASMLRQTSNVELLCLQIRPYVLGTLQYVSQLKQSVFNMQQMNYDLLQKYPVITQGTLQDFVAQAQKQLQNQNQQHKANIKIKQSQTQFTSPPDDPDENKNKKKRIYTGVSYHHKNSSGGKFGGKSPSPKDGQKSLDSSISFKEKGNQKYERRLGVEEDYFVIFDEQSPGEFHGHISSWNDLEPEMQNALYDAGIIKNRKTGRM